MESKWVAGHGRVIDGIVLIQVEVNQLRLQCADYIERHQKDLLPFLIDPDTGATFSDGE